MRRPSTTRAYRSDLREQQAEQTRIRVVEAAAALFAKRGYFGTTVAKIAARAGVSPETVQNHGPKAALLIATVEYTAFGVTGDHNVLELEVGKQFLEVVASGDRDRAVEFHASVLRDVNERGSGTWRALRAAADSDDVVARYYATMRARIRAQNERVLGIYGEHGWLRTDVPFDELVATAIVLGSADVFDRWCRDGGSADAFEKWYVRAMRELVLG